jgi:hypothetical protein
MYKRTDSGSQRLVLGDPQNRILHNLATHLLHYMYSTCTKTQVLTTQKASTYGPKVDRDPPVLTTDLNHQIQGS